MTQLLSGVEAPSDAELISRVRGGESAAYGALFERHVEAARRLGRQLVRGPDVDDLVSEAFAKMLQVLQSGGGPDVAFRAYLLTSVRRLHVDRIRASSRLQTTDDMEKYDDGIPFQDTAVASFENSAAARAFSSLPERWQLVLWHLEVEGQKPAEIAPLLGMSANSVSALAYRAREGLRQAFLTMHLADSPTEECRWVNEHLGAFVRKGLSRRDTTKVQEHLDGCRRCTAMYLELTEVNSNLSGIIAPLLLGAAAAGYLSSSGAVGGIAGVSALFGRVRDTVSANAGVVVGGAVAAGVAAITAATFVLGGGNGDREVLMEADQPVETVRTPSSDEGAGSPGTSPRREAEAPAEDAEDAEDEGVEGGAAPLGAVVEDLAGDESPVLFADALPGPAPGGGSPGSSDAPADAPGPGPGSDPGPGPGSDPGPGPGSDPGPDPGEDPPTPPGPTVTVTTAAVIMGEIVIEFAGIPDLATLQLSLDSKPAGIGFAAGGNCAVAVDGAGTALCTTSITNSLATMASVGSLAAADGQPFTARVPLFVPPGHPNGTTATTVSYLVQGTDGGSQVAATLDVPIADVQLTGPSEPVVAIDEDTYAVPLAVSGVPDGAEAIAYTLEGDATIVRPTTTGCSVDPLWKTLTCASPAHGELHLLVRAQDPATATPVTITAAPITGFIDPSRANNWASFTLAAVDGCETAEYVTDGLPAIGSLTLCPTSDGGPHAYTIVVTFDGVEAGETVRLRLEGQGSSDYLTPSADCLKAVADGAEASVTDPGRADELTCVLPADLSVTFGARLPGQGQGQGQPGSTLIAKFGDATDSQPFP